MNGSIQIQNWLIASVLLGVSQGATWAGEPNFDRDIRPIFSDQCYECHGPDEAAREADLRLDKQADLLEAVGDTNDLSSSELLRRVNSTDPDEIMPPPSTGRQLNETQKQQLEAWVSAGAPWQQHWSFETPRRPRLPAGGSHAANSTHSANNPIDLFVLQGLKNEGLEPSPTASRERLLRRVTLDLTGLPPTLAELDAFLSNQSPTAYDDVVQRLLASPAYGERMAMDWLDVARYADTNGYQGDNERTMWPWRDWVIEAMNQDQPYDEFTVWQLAGDLLPQSTDEQKLATGFCRNHMINGEGGRIAEENRIEYIFDQIETLGTVWMGLTVQCCRCHDHKFDPLAQAEYYKLFAFFNQTPVNGGGGDPQMAPNLAVPTTRQSSQLQTLELELAAVAVKLGQGESDLERDGLDGHACELPEEVAKTLGVKLADRKDADLKRLEEHFKQRQQPLASLAKSYRETRSRLGKAKKGVPKVMIMQDRTKTRETFILNKGLYNQPLDPVTAGTPAFLPTLDSESPNRLELAEWLTSPSHPLMARVTVNRLWQLFFGMGLVKTADDFGVQGEKPSHPELLDWLACEFIDNGWNTKYLVRLIVTSATYQQSARQTPSLIERDPENRLLARGPRTRMPSWMLRDHALVTSGLLVDEQGGASVKPYQPAGIWAEATFGKKKYNQDHGAALYRRSLYVYWRRIVGPTMFFDNPKRQTCSVKRSMTNTPLHALVTLNDVTFVEAARVMAKRLLSDPRLESGSDTDMNRIADAFRRCTSRRPEEHELQILSKRLTQVRDHFEQAPQAAEQLLGVGEASNVPDVSATELASYTTLCLTLLNLDEALNK